MHKKRQVAGAEKARILYKVITCPSARDYKHVIQSNQNKNCQVTPEDINIEENSLIDEEDSVPDVFYGKESGTNAELKNICCRSGEQSKHWFQGSCPRWRSRSSHSKATAQIRKSPCAENHIEANFSMPDM